MPSASHLPQIWTNETLQPLRSMGDPLADSVIAQLFAEGDIAAVNAAVRDFVINEYPAPATLPPVLRDYFEESGKLPEWADPARIAAGERLFWRFGPKLVLILTCYALPFCYLGRNGAPVLALTTKLTSNTMRRIVETAQMMVDIMQMGGLTSPEGRGRRTIQKVRLMHAAIRKLAPTSEKWEPGFGLAVNQEDLLGTLMSFSWVSLDGLAQIKVDVSDQDREDYIHLWNVVGHLLGIEDRFLPGDFHQAAAVAKAIAGHEFGPSEAGRQLTAALVQMLAHMLPGNVFDHAPALLIRNFLGKEWAGWLGIEDSVLTRFAAAPLRAVGVVFSGVIEDSHALSVLAERAGQVLIQSLLFCERGGNRPSFSIPANLRAQWGVNWNS